MAPTEDDEATTFDDKDVEVVHNTDCYEVVT